MLPLDLFNYDLPEELIAQRPLQERDQARMLVLNKEDRTVIHSYFYEIPAFLRPGDLLIINKTRVIKARLFAKAEDTGGTIELLFVELLNDKTFKAMVSSRKKARIGRIFKIDNTYRIIIKDFDNNHAVIEILDNTTVFVLLERCGVVPLPHYIKRPPEEEDQYYYQTIFAEKGASIAAPTAGLHFTERVITDLQKRGIRIAPVFLNVGPGTFRPVKTQDVTAHKMDYEYYEVPKETAMEIEKTKESRKWVVACGTTAVRALESWKFEHSKLSGKTDLFIYPGYEFGVVDALITNFHLPRSTPLILVSAFAGREKIISAYEEAIRLKYRFLSYGDAMLILPKIEKTL